MAYLGNVLERKSIDIGNAIDKGWINLSYNNSVNQTGASGTKFYVAHNGYEGTTDVEYAGAPVYGRGYHYWISVTIDPSSPYRGLFPFSGHNTVTIRNEYNAVRSGILMYYRGNAKVYTDPDEQYFGGIQGEVWNAQLWTIDATGLIKKQNSFTSSDTEFNMYKGASWNLAPVDPSEVTQYLCNINNNPLSISTYAADANMFQPNYNAIAVPPLEENYNKISTSFTPLTTAITNINVFEDYESLERWLKEGIIDTPEPEPDEPYPGEDSPIGTNYPSTNFNDGIDNESVLSRALLLTKNNLVNIANVIYNTNSQGVLDGLKFYGNNPASFIVDCFYIPFDPHQFFTNAGTTDKTNFGTLKDVSIGTHEVIGKCSNLVTVANVAISGAYGDFRDYISSNYYIYLPYCGIMGLDINKYMYKNLSVKVFFDVRTGALKYYLLANNVVQDIYEASVRQNMPLISTDTYQASREKISSIFSMTGSAVTLGAGIATANPALIASSFAGGAESALNLQKEPLAHCSGGFSPASTIVDSLDIMIWIEQKEITYPENLKSKYGIPDNKVARLSDFTGFVQCDDIILESNQSQARKDRAKQLIMQGIFI